MKDLSGRPYATVASTKAGDVLEADGDFTCMREGAKLTVTDSEDGLMVPCRDGGHCLDGQIQSEDGTDFYMGLYPVG